MIHRRALGHVNHDQALDIIEFVHSGDVRPFHDAGIGKKELPPFQPGDRILSSDRAFAINLFGQDQWPADLTAADLKEMKPADLPVPFRFPEWNDDKDKYDWLPDRKLPNSIVNNDRFIQANSNYNRNPTDDNLVRLSRIFFEVSHGWAGRKPWGENAVSTSDEMAELIELNRWMAARVAIHFLRKGYDYNQIERFLEGSADGEPIHNREYSPVQYWWFVGNLMRASNAYDVTDLPEEYGRTKKLLREGAKWFYLSWMMNPELKFDTGTTYFAEMLGTHFEKPRVAAYVMAHMVTTAELGVSSVWHFPVRIAHDTPRHWSSNFIRFILNQYEARIERGDYLDRGFYWIRKRMKEGLDNFIERRDQLTDSDKKFIREKQQLLIDWVDQQEENRK